MLGVFRSIFSRLNRQACLKWQKYLKLVIPAEAGIQALHGIARVARDDIYTLGPRLRGDDDFGKFHPLSRGLQPNEIALEARDTM